MYTYMHIYVCEYIHICMNYLHSLLQIACAAGCRDSWHYLTAQHCNALQDTATHLSTATGVQ